MFYQYKKGNCDMKNAKLLLFLLPLLVVGCNKTPASSGDNPSGGNTPSGGDVVG